METAFRGRCPAADPETYVLAWLAVLHAAADAPSAAAALAARLARLPVGAWSPRQRRVIELLEFVANHRRVQAARSRPVKPPPKEGLP